MMWDSIEQIADSVRSGKVSALSLVEKALDIAQQNDDYDAILEVIKDRSIERARAIDQRVKSGNTEGKLLGVPFLAKDNFLTFGSKTTAASNILKSFEAPYQSTVIDRLEAEGAICIGKTNLDAFGHGSSTENSDFVVTKNAHSKDHVPGGSSGGSATAVALGIVPFSVATDTGGSIRQPASFSGVFGMKPTYGLVSRYGVIAMASSTDTVGPITNSAKDAAIILDVIAGRDERDMTTIEAEEFYSVDPSKKQKVAVIKEYMGDGVDEDVRDSISQTISKLKESGIEVDEISLPSLQHALAAYYVVVPAEISSNLARYDGVKFGHRSDSEKLEDMFEQSRAEGLGYEAKRRIMIGSYVLSSGFYDAYYQKAQKVRTLIINEFKEAFGSYDVLLGPVAPTKAFKIGGNTSDPLKMYLEDIMTVSASLAGLPAASLPISTSEGLPIGLQIIGKQKGDKDVLNFAAKIEELNRG